MMKKLSQQSGETLVEALISLMIAVLAMGMLTTTVMVASNINNANRERDKEYASDLLKAEGMSSDGTEEAWLKVEYDALESTEEVKIILYGGEENNFVSYEKMEN